MPQLLEQSDAPPQSSAQAELHSVILHVSVSSPQSRLQESPGQARVQPLAALHSAEQPPPGQVKEQDPPVQVKEQPDSPELLQVLLQSEQE